MNCWKLFKCAVTYNVTRNGQRECLKMTVGQRQSAAKLRKRRRFNDHRKHVKTEVSRVGMKSFRSARKQNVRKIWSQLYGDIKSAEVTTLSKKIGTNDHASRLAPRYRGIHYFKNAKPTYSTLFNRKHK